MRIDDFIESRDIAVYWEKIGYEPSPMECAYLIWQSHRQSVDQKIAAWEEHVPAAFRNGKPYNYYPRGRVEIKEKGKAKIFLNPDIATDEIVAYIVEKFRLQYREVKVIADGSKHYHYAAEEG